MIYEREECNTQPAFIFIDNRGRFAIMLHQFRTELNIRKKEEDTL